MMARTTLILDTEAVSDSIVTTIKRGFGDRLMATIRESFDRGFDKLVKAIIAPSMRNNEEQLDINGLRNQIIANVQVLLPIQASTRGMSLVMGQQFAVLPDIHVITVGREPAIKAFVLQGNATCCERFLQSGYGATASEALVKMLLHTQKMLELHIDEIGTYSAKYSRSSPQTSKRALDQFKGEQAGFNSTPSNNGNASYSSDEDSAGDYAGRVSFLYR